MTDTDQPQTQPPAATTSLEHSPRFEPPATRRDFLGLASIWAAVIAFAAALVGAMRLPMPAVFPESKSKVKVGPPDTFAADSATYLAHLNVWVFRDQQGLYAVSSICTHLGCIAGRDGQTGKFTCPCHGSVFTSEGKVTAGPAPSALNWLEMSVAPDGQIVIDQQRTVPLGTRLEV